MSSTVKQTNIPRFKQNWCLPALVISIAVVWILVWGQLQNFADWLTSTLIGLQPETHFAESVNFFLYDVPKNLILLAGMIYLVTIARSFLSPEQARAALGGRREGIGNVLAANSHRNQGRTGVGQPRIA